MRLCVRTQAKRAPDFGNLRHRVCTAQVLVACLGSPNLDVTLAAMRATSAFIQARGSA